MKINNENFIQQLKDRNEDSLDYIMNTFGNLIYKISYMYLNSKELSEGCVYDVLFKVWTSIDKFKYPDDKFKNWICAITKYTAIDIVRKEHKFINDSNYDSLDLHTTDNIEENILINEEINLLNQHLNNFKEIDKKIFIDRFYYDISVKSIAKKYNLTPNSVSLKIHRMREKLKSIRT